jgi:hypothetical protein
MWFHFYRVNGGRGGGRWWFNVGGGGNHQVIWLREGKSETDERLGFNSCI